MIRRGVMRHRRVHPNDGREPLLRLLQDGANPRSGMVEVQYHEQWRTLFKAQTLGYVDDHQRLTEAGRKYALNQPLKDAP